MKPEYADCEVDDVPVSALLSEDRKNRYGSVPGLPDEELAEPWELERQVFVQEWGPILRLPKPKRSLIQPHIDEYFGMDWGAFATVDFERYSGGFDKARYKAEKLREELRDTVIRLAVIRNRLSRAELLVLKHLGQGLIDIDDIEDVGMLCTARLYLRADRLRKQIKQLRDVSWSQVRQELAEVLK